MVHMMLSIIIVFLMEALCLLAGCFLEELTRPFRLNNPNLKAEILQRSGDV